MTVDEEFYIRADRFVKDRLCRYRGAGLVCCILPLTFGGLIRKISSIAPRLCEDLPARKA